MATAAALALRSVTLQADDGSSITVNVRNTSPATVSMRKKVDSFIRRSMAIWKELPAKDTGLLATAAVLDEVIHCATAFHTNAQGTVDIVWVKKDIPMEAIKDADVGYWRGAAGPAPKLEQREIALIRDIPQPVMDEIAENNDHDLIAHFLYAWINFWCIVLKHWIIWLACIFYYGYLCILQPTIIVGESSKLFNIMRYLSPRHLFHRDLVEEQFNAFLNGQFTLALLHQLIIVGIKERKWDDYEMSPSDYIHVIGLPVIQPYGPLPRHYAIYIPKMHPYAPYHVRSLCKEMVEVDRYVRLMIELALDIVKEAAPIPLDATRQACLAEVRSRIMSEASRIGLLSGLNTAKSQLILANQGFVGARARAARARVTEAIAKGTRDDFTTPGRPDRGKIVAVGDTGSTARKSWVVDNINKLRDQLESGQTVGLLACPTHYQHGTQEHAFWLFSVCGIGAELINSASGHSRFGTSDNPTAEELEQIAIRGDATGGAVVTVNSFSIAPEDALRQLALINKERKGMVYLCKCPHCSRKWIIKEYSNYCYHDCVEMRKQFLPALDAQFQGQKALELEMLANMAANPGDPLAKRAGVTRCIPPAAFAWSTGERISMNDAFFDVQVDEKRSHVRPNLASPKWERVMDERGRLSAYCIERYRLSWPYQLLALPEAASLLEKTQDGKAMVPTPVDNIIFTTVKDALALCKMEQPTGGIDISEGWIVSVKDSKTAGESMKNQLKAFMKAEAPQLKAPSFDSADIVEAAEKRITMRRLRPFHYDIITKQDRLPEVVAREGGMASSVPPPIASTSPSVDTASGTCVSVAAGTMAIAPSASGTSAAAATSATTGTAVIDSTVVTAAAPAKSAAPDFDDMDFDMEGWEEDMNLVTNDECLPPVTSNQPKMITTTKTSTSAGIATTFISTTATATATASTSTSQAIFDTDLSFYMTGWEDDMSE